MVKSSGKIEKIRTFESSANSGWLNHIACFVKRMSKNNTVRWASNIVFVLIALSVYFYLRNIFAHTIVDFPFWIWGIIPTITIVVLLLFVGVRKKAILFKIFFGFCIGTVITGLLIILFQTTNYWFADSALFHGKAYVIGKRHINASGHRSLFGGMPKYDVNLMFLDNNEYFRLDDADAYKKCDQGDTVIVTWCKGLYGIPVVQGVDN